MHKQIVRVLLTGIGGPTPRSIARALKSKDTVLSYYIVGVDCNRLAIGLYDDKYVDKSYLVPKHDDCNYWSVIENLILDHQIDIAIVQPEAEVEEWALRCKRAQAPCKTLLPPYDLVTILKDKSIMNDYLKETDTIPKSIVIDRKTLVNKAAEHEFAYPYWVRSATGSSGLGSLKIDRPNLLEGWLMINDRIEKFTISEFLPGRNLACKLLYNNGVLLRAMCAERVNYVMAKTSPSGITGNTSFGRLINSSKAVEVSTRALSIIADRINVPLHGIFTADLKEDQNGVPKITEINVRNVAFNSVFIAGGINIAEEMVFVMLGSERMIAKPAEKLFQKSYIFLRDVDSEPIVIQESELL